MTVAAGLPAYEISNHARPGEESRHNLTYWRYQDYIGIGPGAHGRRGDVATTRHRKPENYIAAVAETGHGIAEARPLEVVHSSPQRQPLVGRAATRAGHDDRGRPGTCSDAAQDVIRKSGEDQLRWRLVFCHAVTAAPARRSPWP